VMSTNFLIRLVVAGLVLWIVIVALMLSGPLMKPALSADEQLIARLNRAVGELEELRQQNRDLRSTPDATRNNKTSSDGSASYRTPPHDYEVFRRRAEDNIRELWYFARSQLDQVIKRGDGAIKEQVRSVK